MKMCALEKMTVNTSVLVHDCSSVCYLVRNSQGGNRVCDAADFHWYQLG